MYNIQKNKQNNSSLALKSTFIKKQIEKISQTNLISSGFKSAICSILFSCNVNAGAIGDWSYVSNNEQEDDYKSAITAPNGTKSPLLENKSKALEIIKNNDKVIIKKEGIVKITPKMDKNSFGLNLSKSSRQFRCDSGVDYVENKLDKKELDKITLSGSCRTLYGNLGSYIGIKKGSEFIHFLGSQGINIAGSKLKFNIALLKKMEEFVFDSIGKKETQLLQVAYGVDYNLGIKHDILKELEASIIIFNSFGKDFGLLSQSKEFDESGNYKKYNNFGGISASMKRIINGSISLKINNETKLDLDSSIINTKIDGMYDNGANITKEANYGTTLTYRANDKHQFDVGLSSGVKNKQLNGSIGYEYNHGNGFSLSLATKSISGNLTAQGVLNYAFGSNNKTKINPLFLSSVNPDFTLYDFDPNKDIVSTDIISKKIIENKEIVKDKLPVIEGEFSTIKVTEGESSTIELKCIDGDLDECTFLSNPFFSSWVTITNKGIITASPDFNKSGTHTVQVAAKANGKVIVFPIQIIVKNKDRSSIITGINKINGSEGEKLSLRYNINDPDGNKGVFSINPTLQGLSISPIGELSLELGSQSFGTYNETIILTTTDNDGIERITELGITIIVANKDSASVITGPKEIETAENTSLIKLYTSEDADGNKGTFSMDSSFSGVSISPTGSLSVISNFTDSGTYNETIILTTIDDDNIKRIVSYPISIIILETDRAPTITGTPDNTVDEDSNYTFLPEGFDADGNNLTYSIQNKPSWASFNTITGELSGIPAYDDFGNYDNIIISVIADKLITNLAPFSIFVKNKDRAPVYNTNLPTTSVAEDSAYVYNPDFTEPDGDIMSYSIQNKPSWASFDSTTGVLSGIPDFKDSGTTTGIIISATANGLTTDLPNFDITVTNTDIPAPTGFSSNIESFTGNNTPTFTWDAISIAEIIEISSDNGNTWTELPANSTSYTFSTLIDGIYPFLLRSDIAGQKSLVSAPIVSEINTQTITSFVFNPTPPDTQGKTYTSITLDADQDIGIISSIRFDSGGSVNIINTLGKTIALSMVTPNTMFSFLIIEGTGKNGIPFTISFPIFLPQ